MALHANNNTSNYLSLASAPVSGYPYSISFWHSASNYGGSKIGLHMSGGGTSTYLAINSAGVIMANRPVGGPTRSAQTSTSPSTNTWHHCCGLAISETSRKAYLDGGGEGTNSNSVTMGTLSSSKMHGDSSIWATRSQGITHMAVWDIELTADEIASLAAGMCPLFIRPASLKMYVPQIINDTTPNDYLDGTTWTENGTMVYNASQPIVQYPSGQLLAFPTMGEAQEPIVIANRFGFQDIWQQQNTWNYSAMGFNQWTRQISGETIADSQIKYRGFMVNMGRMMSLN